MTEPGNIPNHVTTHQNKKSDDQEKHDHGSLRELEAEPMLLLLKMFAANRPTPKIHRTREFMCNQNNTSFEHQSVSAGVFPWVQHMQTISHQALYATHT